VIYQSFNTNLTQFDLNNYIGVAAQSLTPKKSRKRLCKALDKKVLKLFGESTSKAIRNAVDAEVKRCMARLETLKNERDSYDLFKTDYRKIPWQELSGLDRGFGIAAIVVMCIAALIIPIIASITIMEADKLALLADVPLLAGAFGAIALAGAMGSTHYHSKLKTDADKNAYEKNLIKLTAGAFLLFVSAYALSAYPITLGGKLQDVANSAWGGSETTQQKVGGFELKIPTAITLIVTAILELFAAPTFHLIASDTLFPKVAVKTDQSEVIKHYNDVAIPEAEAELQIALSKQNEIVEHDLKREQSIQTYIQSHLVQFDNILAKVRQAKIMAVEQTLAANALPLNLASDSQTPPQTTH